MSSLRQIEANRRNAQQSTGPRSVEGKAASSRNALKSGIDAKSQTLPGEKSDDLERLTCEYHEQYRPSTTEARYLVDTLVSNEWLLRRFRRIEVQILKHEMETGYSIDAKNPAGHAYLRAERCLDRLQRRINAAERNYHRALKELQSLLPEIGFVPPSTPGTETEVRPSGSAPEPPQPSVPKLTSFRYPSDTDTEARPSGSVPAPSTPAPEG